MDKKNAVVFPLYPKTFAVGKIIFITKCPVSVLIKRWFPLIAMVSARDLQSLVSPLPALQDSPPPHAIIKHWFQTKESEKSRFLILEDTKDNTVSFASRKTFCLWILYLHISQVRPIPSRKPTGENVIYSLCSTWKSCFLYKARVRCHFTTKNDLPWELVHPPPPPHPSTHNLLSICIQNLVYFHQGIRRTKYRRTLSFKNSGGTEWPLIDLIGPETMCKLVCLPVPCGGANGTILHAFTIVPYILVDLLSPEVLLNTKTWILKSWW